MGKNPFSKENNFIDNTDYAEISNPVNITSNRGKTPHSERDTGNEKQSKMNPKVLETWINETLQDAEHLDIPGVILKPEHKKPISRYGIGRLEL